MSEKITQQTIKTLAPMLVSGFFGVMPTDTIYGIVGSALSKETVENIYKLRKRNLKKPMIILIGDMADLKKFGISLTQGQLKVLDSYWPGKISVVLELKKKRFEYLHRGKQSLAFRMPAEEGLRKLLKKTGPLVAPSANFEGEKPAETCREAKKYFKDEVDFYVDAGKLKSEPSTLISLDKKGSVKLLRQGAGVVSEK